MSVCLMCIYVSGMQLWIADPIQMAILQSLSPTEKQGGSALGSIKTLQMMLLIPVGSPFSLLAPLDHAEV